MASKSGNKQVQKKSPQATNDMIVTRNRSNFFKRKLRDKERSMKRITDLLKSPTSLKHSKSKKPRGHSSQRVPDKTHCRKINFDSSSKHSNLTNSNISTEQQQQKSKSNSLENNKTIKRAVEKIKLKSAEKSKPLVSPSKLIQSFEVSSKETETSKDSLRLSNSYTSEEIDRERKDIKHTEYYPDKVKRNVKVKQIVLKPKIKSEVLGSMNKRKRTIPRKDTSTLPKIRHIRSSTFGDEDYLSEDLNISYSSLSMDEIIRQTEDEESLTEEDMLEILTCPSPVWWEDPPDKELLFLEDALDFAYPSFEEMERTSFNEEKQNSKSKGSLTESLCALKSEIRFDGDNAIKRNKLEVILNSIQCKLDNCDKKISDNTNNKQVSLVKESNNINVSEKCKNIITSSLINLPEYSKFSSNLSSLTRTPEIMLRSDKETFATYQNKPDLAISAEAYSSELKPKDEINNITIFEHNNKTINPSSNVDKTTSCDNTFNKNKDVNKKKFVSDSAMSTKQKDTIGSSTKDRSNTQISKSKPSILKVSKQTNKTIKIPRESLTRHQPIIQTKECKNDEAESLSSNLSLTELNKCNEWFGPQVKIVEKNTLKLNNIQINSIIQSNVFHEATLKCVHRAPIVSKSNDNLVILRKVSNDCSEIKKDTIIPTIEPQENSKKIINVKNQTINSRVVSRSVLLTQSSSETPMDVHNIAVSCNSTAQNVFPKLETTGIQGFSEKPIFVNDAAITYKSLQQNDIVKSGVSHDSDAQSEIDSKSIRSTMVTNNKRPKLIETASLMHIRVQNDDTLKSKKKKLSSETRITENGHEYVIVRKSFLKPKVTAIPNQSDSMPNIACNKVDSKKALPQPLGIVQKHISKSEHNANLIEVLTSSSTLSMNMTKKYSKLQEKDLKITIKPATENLIASSIAADNLPLKKAEIKPIIISKNNMHHNYNLKETIDIIKKDKIPQPPRPNSAPYLSSMLKSDLVDFESNIKHFTLPKESETSNLDNARAKLEFQINKTLADRCIPRKRKKSVNLKMIVPPVISNDSNNEVNSNKITAQEELSGRISINTVRSDSSGRVSNSSSICDEEMLKDLENIDIPVDTSTKKDEGNIFSVKLFVDSPSSVDQNTSAINSKDINKDLKVAIDYRNPILLPNFDKLEAVDESCSSSHQVYSNEHAEKKVPYCLLFPTKTNDNMKKIGFPKIKGKPMKKVVINRLDFQNKLIDLTKGEANSSASPNEIKCNKQRNENNSKDSKIDKHPATATSCLKVNYTNAVLPKEPSSSSNKKSIYVSATKNVNYCHECSSIFETDECTYCAIKSQTDKKVIVLPSDSVVNTFSCDS